MSVDVYSRNLRTIEDDHGLDLMVQQSHQPQQEYAHVWTIRQHPSRFRIATRLGNLGEPYGGVDGESLVGERLDGDAMAHRQEETPEVLNAHVVLIWIATACRLGDSSTLSEEEERGRWYLQNCTRSQILC